MNIIQLATKSDSEEILKLYRSFMHGAADWNENYPSQETIDFDLSRDALYVMKNDAGEIIAAISIDQDEEVEELPNWNPDLAPGAELSRLAVSADYHGQGISKQMIRHVFGVLKEEGKKSVHILVREGHKVALNSYEHLGFKTVGQCEYVGKKFVCMEIEL